MTTTMTNDQFKQAQHVLGLSDTEMAGVLGYEKQMVRRWKCRPGTNSHRPVHPAVARLMRAYLDGYRPPDWPKETSR